MIVLCPWDSQGKNTSVGCHLLLQGIFSTRYRTHISCVSCTGRWILYHWATWEAHLPWSFNLKYISSSPFSGCLFFFLLVSRCQMLYFPYWTCLLSIPPLIRSCRRVGLGLLFHNCISRKQLAHRRPLISTCWVNRWHCFSKLLSLGPLEPGMFQVEWRWDEFLTFLSPGQSKCLPRRSNQSILKEISPKY